MKYIESRLWIYDRLGGTENLLDSNSNDNIYLTKLAGAPNGYYTITEPITSVNNYRFENIASQVLEDGVYTIHLKSTTELSGNSGLLILDIGDEHIILNIVNGEVSYTFTVVNGTEIIISFCGGEYLSGSDIPAPIIGLQYDFTIMLNRGGTALPFSSYAPDFKGENLSQYVASGDSYKEDISDVIDTAELTLLGYNVAKEFTPETKFIYEKVELEDGDEVSVIRYEMVVDKDIVNKSIISDDKYYDHHIFFGEPSIISQKRLVDNISATYRLQDVSLTTKPSFNLDTPYKTNYIYKPKYPYEINSSWKFGTNSEGTLGLKHTYVYGKNFSFDKSYIKQGDNPQKYYIDIGITYDSSTTYTINEKVQYNGYTYSALQETTGNTPSGTASDNDYWKYISTAGELKIKLPLIKVSCSINDTNQYSESHYISIDYRVIEMDLSGNILNDNFISGTLHEKSSLRYIIPDYNYTLSNFKNEDILLEGVEKFDGSSLKYIARRYTAFNTDYYNQAVDLSAYNNSVITLSNIQPNRRYKVVVSIHKYENIAKLLFNIGNVTISCVEDNNINPTKIFYYYRGIIQANNGNGLTDTMSVSTDDYSETSATAEFQTYNFSSKEILFSSASPYTAYNLLKKAIINSALIEKKDGVSIYETPNTFYLDENFVNELKNTNVIENFYNQKNLWQILLDVGKYIHAIPRLEFGDMEHADMLKITFDRLGSPNESKKDGTITTIQNFKGVDDYISACSSYITNMVQMDNEISEWVVAKSSNDEYTVSNDSSNLQLSKNIIELLSVTAYVYGETAKELKVSDGASAGITDYIFEKAVYNTLPTSTDTIPNKGVALYYNLGENIIQGFEYRSPTKNTGEPFNDYAIKKVLGVAFGATYTNNPSSNDKKWINIKINDFKFLVRYRTKDSLRQEQSRPDLRKYLLNSIYDRVPIHSQFNNQEDILVDSIKFGNNIYGKLIRTGNTNYSVTEWNESLSQLKHKGELYRINETDNTYDSKNGNLYYVASVNHTFYGEFIISQVEFSKDFNQLSPIIGIPSEPRFYEISERSSIRREFCINDYILLTSDREQGYGIPKTYLSDINHLMNLIFGKENATYSKYAITTFKNDKDAIEMAGQGGEEFYVDIISPINAYSSENVLTYEWDMEDNFSAGNRTLEGDVQGAPETNDQSYRILDPVRYTDKYGRAQLLDFYILKDLGSEPTHEQVRNFPISPITTDINKAVDEKMPYIINYADYITASNYVGGYSEKKDYFGLGLIKDCREAISVNYNIHNLVDSDTFVLSPFIFKNGKKNVRVVLLSAEVNKLSSGYVSLQQSMIVPYNKNGNKMLGYFDLTYSVSGRIGTIDMGSILKDVNDHHFDGNKDYEQVRAIAIIYDIPDTESSDSIPQLAKFIYAKNLPMNWSISDKKRFWYIQPPCKEKLFTNHQ